LFSTESHSPVKELQIRIQNQESHEIIIQGIAPFVHLQPGETHLLTVPVGQDTYGAYVCAFDTSHGAIRVKYDIAGASLDGASIRFKGMVGNGP
jgi:hypothetical protein